MRNDTVNHFVGLGMGTTSCNNGDQPLDWFALPQHRSPRYSAKSLSDERRANNNDRFEQIGQSWLKHAFTALEGNDCSFGCTPAGCDGHPPMPRLLRSLLAQFKCGSNRAGFARLGEPIYGRLPIDRKQSYRARHTGTSHRVTVARQRPEPIAKSRSRPISPKRNMSLRTNIHGASRILANATCITTPLTVSSA